MAYHYARLENWSKTSGLYVCTALGIYKSDGMHLMDDLGWNAQNRNSLLANFVPP